MGGNDKKYIKLFIGFFLMMLLFTFLSRGADSVAMAKVDTENVKPSTLAHHTSVRGRIRAADQVYVWGEKGCLVKKAFVGPGQRVKAGDPLFLMDLDRLGRQLEEAEYQLSISRLNLQKALAVGENGGDKDLVENARRALERAKWDRDFNAQLNGGKVLLADQRAVEDKEAALDAAEKQREDDRLSSQIASQISRLEIAEKEKAAAKLRAVYEGGGEIRSDISGTVGWVFAEPGKELSQESLCAIIPEGASFFLEAELEDEDARYMKIGDSVSVTLEGKNVPIPDLAILSLGSDGGKTKITVELPQGAEVAGDDFPVL